MVAIQLFEYELSNNLYINRINLPIGPQRNSEATVLRVHNDLLAAGDTKQPVFLVVLDMSAAFDTIDNDLLLERLQPLGIESTALS